MHYPKEDYTMILVNTDYISGKNFEMIGLVRGTMIQSVHFGKDIMNSFKTLVGGELTSYTEMMNEARAIATKRMCEDAEALSCRARQRLRHTARQLSLWNRHTPRNKDKDA